MVFQKLKNFFNQLIGKSLASQASEVAPLASPQPSEIEKIKMENLEDMQSSFVSMAAHELRTPLTAIKGYLSVYLNDYQDTLNDDQKSLLGHIASSTEQLLVLVNNLLSVSKIERGTLNLSPTGVSLVDLAEQLTDDHRSRAVQKNIDLKFMPSQGEIARVNVDKIRVSEVISNFISNAINYTDANGKVVVWVEQRGNQVMLHVADNGQGIPKEAIPHLFNKFYRVSETALAQKNQQGTGLGLYISKAIIDMHKGKVWINSELGKGSVFSFSLPAYT